MTEKRTHFDVPTRWDLERDLERAARHLKAMGDGKLNCVRDVGPLTAGPDTVTVPDDLASPFSFVAVMPPGAVTSITPGNREIEFETASGVTAFRYMVLS